MVRKIVIFNFALGVSAQARDTAQKMGRGLEKIIRRLEVYSHGQGAVDAVQAFVFKR